MVRGNSFRAVYGTGKTWRERQMETNRDAVIGAGDYWLAAMQLNTMRKLPAKFKLELTCRCSGAASATRKLSNNLSIADCPQGAAHQLTRQLHQGHVPTL